jgi:hypothetical protein
MEGTDGRPVLTRSLDTNEIYEEARRGGILQLPYLYCGPLAVGIDSPVMQKVCRMMQNNNGNIMTSLVIYWKSPNPSSSPTIITKISLENT